MGNAEVKAQKVDKKAAKKEKKEKKEKKKSKSSEAEHEHEHEHETETEQPLTGIYHKDEPTEKYYNIGDLLGE